MRLVLRIIAATAALSAVFTAWLILVLVSRGFRPMQAGASPLGVLTLIGWAVTLTLGPFTAVQLWRYRDSGRIAGVILFGFGGAYYLAGLLWLATPVASAAQIIAAAVVYSIPVAVLSLPAARRACTASP